MKVQQLARLLDSIVHGLDGVVAAPAAREAGNFADAIQAFGTASVSEFTTFLQQFGTEFQQTGKITPQGKIVLNKPAKEPKQDDTQRVASAITSIKELFAEIDRGSVDEQRVEQVLKPVEKLTVALLLQVLAGLDIAEKPKGKPKIMAKIRQVVHHQMESRARSASVGGHAMPRQAVGAAY